MTVSKFSLALARHEGDRKSGKLPKSNLRDSKTRLILD
jgi:hypothetical protein